MPTRRCGFPAGGVTSVTTAADSATCCTLRPESVRTKGKCAARGLSQVAQDDASCDFDEPRIARRPTRANARRRSRIRELFSPSARRGNRQSHDRSVFASSVIRVSSWVSALRFHLCNTGSLARSDCRLPSRRLQILLSCFEHPFAGESGLRDGRCRSWAQNNVRIGLLRDPMGRNSPRHGLCARGAATLTYTGGPGVGTGYTGFSLRKYHDEWTVSY